jgi:hypothetical protein
MCTMLHRNICIKIPSFYQNIAKTIKQKKIIFSCIRPSLSKIKNYIVFSYNKNSKYILACILSFNNLSIKVMRTRSIFQKKQKKLFCFLLVSGITNLYVRRIPDIKRVVLLCIEIRMVRIYPIR